MKTVDINGSSCGVSAARGGSRIIGGRFSVPGAHPWIAYFGLAIVGCGGVIIDYNWILTARHCLEKTFVNGTFRDQLAKEVRVRAGHISFLGSRQQTHRRATKIIRHPEADVALVKLNASLPSVFVAGSSTSIMKICLPKSAKPPAPGTKVILAGYGLAEASNSDYEHMSPPLRLKEVEMILSSDDRCAEADKAYKFPPKYRLNRKYEICAESGAGVKVGSACKGDSGSAVVRKVGNQYELVGVITKTNCRNFTEIESASKLLRWITDNAQG